MKEFKFIGAEWPRTMDAVTAKWLVLQVTELLARKPAGTEELFGLLNQDPPAKWKSAVEGLPYTWEWIHNSIHYACVKAGAESIWALKEKA